MIKLLVTIVFKSSAAMKVFFIGTFEIAARSIDNLNYYLFNPIRLIRFQDVRDFLTDHYMLIILAIIILILLFIYTVDNKDLKEDNQSL